MFKTQQRASHSAGSPFLPLAFRFATAFGLFVLHLALPQEQGQPLPSEGLYLLGLMCFFLESVWEASRAMRDSGLPFATPSRNWIRFNILLDILLVAWVISFQGVDQERFATIYIFPVLASAFYLSIVEIISVGLLSSLAHIATVLCFTSGILAPFGHSGPSLGKGTPQQTFILGFASLQIFATTLVVVLIRKHLEHLRTNLSQSEATVDQLSNLYRHVVESMFSGLITLDMDKKLTSANPAAEQILKRSLSPGISVEELGIIELILESNFPKDHRFEQRFITGGGEQRILGGNVAPLKDNQGQQTGYLVLFQDLTDLKALEARTRLQDRLALMGELASELAHELRNPMASIQGCVQILTGGKPSEPMMDRVLTILDRESERVNTLVTGFLDFTKPRPVEVQTIPFQSLMEEILASFELDPRKGAIQLEHGAIPPCWIKADPVCAHQVFGNLLSNARKALRQQSAPKVKLQFHTQAPWLTVDVIDNGCGMDSEQLKHVFIPFSSGFDEGTGLGMSLVFQFIQRMNWDIEVESEPGLGTTIRLKIPMTEAP